MTEAAARAPKRAADPRLAALTRFAAAITLFNIFGHTLLGFEQAWLHPLVGLAAAYLAELALERTLAWSEGRPPRWAGGWRRLAEFLLPAHITGLAVAMLLYPNQRLAPVVFGATAAIASKYLFRVPVGGRLRHFFNPSNFGITATLLLFPWVGIAMPYQFTENLGRVGDWALPALIVVTGSLLNARLTRKMPLILTWVGLFASQAVVRSLVFGTPVVAALHPMTGLAFVLFTFYMVSDPSTTPRTSRGQVAFGAAVATVYGLLLSSHVVFTLFFSLSVVCLGRGVGLWLAELAARRRPALARPALAGGGAAVAAGGIYPGRADLGLGSGRSRARRDAGAGGR